MNIMPKSVKQFNCEYCSFTCSKKSNYNQHLLTSKHINHANAHFLEQKNADPESTHYTCKKCSKNYKARNSLWYHEQHCELLTTKIEKTTNSSSEDMQMNLILELVKQNQDFKNLLIQQSSQMMEQNNTILEVAKNSQVNNINTISHSNNNNNNKTFNLNFFLNETCKDAMNMKDFIKSLELTLPELEKMGEIGFAEGMSRLFVDRLNKLDITKRPIHCSDVKREIIHIKDDNKWERDNANLDRLRKIIKQLTIKNILRVDDWKKANTGCTEYNSRKNGQYLKIHIQALGPVDDAEVKRDFGKIIRRVAETTAIDKKYLCM
jgi:hypothetical protein